MTMTSTTAAAAHHDHGHAHDHGHDHDHDHAVVGKPHVHVHVHPELGATRAPAHRPAPSLVRMSLTARLALAVGLSAALWAAVAWATTPIAG